jgi:hypothetical protein
MKSISTLGIVGLSVLMSASCTDQGALHQTSITKEPPGANCVDGGNRLSFGADADADGQLSASETTATAFVCDGAASRGAMVTNSDLPVGDTHCPQGGYSLAIGVDKNGNGSVDADEGAMRYVCNGLTGAEGAEGAAGDAGAPAQPGERGEPGAIGPEGLPGPDGSTGPIGITGPIGSTGTVGSTGADGNTGPSGPEGPAGAPGDAANQLPTVFLLTPEPEGPNCFDPGTRMDSGRDRPNFVNDDDDNDEETGEGLLQPEEIDDTVFLCRPPLFNSSFDDGAANWIQEDGVFFGRGVAFLVNHGGHSVAQDFDLTGDTAVSVLLDWDTDRCDGEDEGDDDSTTLALVVEPLGGGAPLLTQPLGICDVTGLTQTVPPGSLVDISSVANQPVRIKVVITGTAHWHLNLNSVKLVHTPQPEPEPGQNDAGVSSGVDAGGGGVVDAGGGAPADAGAAIQADAGAPI